MAGPPPMYTFGASSGGDYYRPADRSRDVRDDERYDIRFHPINDTPRYAPDDRSRDFRDDERRHDFSFRPVHDIPRYPQNDTSLIPDGHRNQDSYEVMEAHDAPDQYRRKQNRGRRARGRGRGRGGYQFTSTHERPLLSTQREKTPEQLPGMIDAQNGQVKFLSADDLSDSEEKDMDLESADENDEPENVIPSKSNGLEASQRDAAATDEPPRKKQVLIGIDGHPKAESTRPKWSNPDPYTVLPPPDDSLKKKKDLIKLIRKARVANAKSQSTKNSLAANEDFIAFDFDDDVMDISDSDDGGEVAEVKEGVLGPGEGVSGAPTGPASGRFSHLQNLHGQSAKDTSTITGPPKSATATRPLQYQANSSNTKSNVLPSPDSDPALGSRKRTHEDEIKADPARKARAIKSLPRHDGSVLEDWLPNDPQTATPWHNGEHSATSDMSYVLHKEIVDFYNYVRPQNFEEVVRNDLLKRLRCTIQTIFPGSDVRPFGSFAAGIYLPNADMDVVILSQAYMQRGRKSICQSKNDIFRLSHALEGKKVCSPGSIEVIAFARVPLIKFVDKITKLRVDLSFENDTGLVAISTFQSWKAEFPAMPIIVTLIKQMLMMRGLHEVVNGGLGGFSVTCLVTSLLQNMPLVQTGSLKPESHLGEIFMQFLDFYGNNFNTTTTGIQLDPPGYIDKRFSNLPYRAANMHRLSILDPNASNNDVSGGTKKILLILKVFSRAHGFLRDRMADLLDDDTSAAGGILKPVFSANYTAFTRQRERLRQLYHMDHS